MEQGGREGGSEGRQAMVILAHTSPPLTSVRRATDALSW